MIKIGRFLQILALIMLAAGAQPAISAVWQWSTSANSNATADPTINWAEGMSPSSVNDSARAMMAAIAVRRNDQGGLQTAGTTGALTLTTFTGYPSLAALNGQILTFIHGPGGNDAGATITIDGIGPFPVIIGSSPVPAGVLTSGGVYSIVCYIINSQCRLIDSYANAFGVPLGSILWSTLTTAPNGNFVVANGQCISTTTYATYWAAMGSPAPGACSAGFFQIVDLRGRIISGLDTLPGSGAAGRLTSSSTGCGTAMTTVGAVCANGLESWVLSVTQLASHTHSNSLNDLGHTHNISAGPNTMQALAAGTAGAFGFAGGAAGVRNVDTANGGVITLTNNSAPMSITNAAAGGGAGHPSVPPTLGLVPFLRVI